MRYTNLHFTYSMEEAAINTRMEIVGAVKDGLTRQGKTEYADAEQRHCVLTTGTKKEGNAERYVTNAFSYDGCDVQVAKLQRASLHDPVKVEVCNKYQTVDKLLQFYLFIPAREKVDTVIVCGIYVTTVCFGNVDLQMISCR